MTARPCIDCGRLTTNGNRCAEHDRGGRSIADMRRRNTNAKRAIWKHPAWKRVREQVLRRDGYTCVDCGRHRNQLGPYEKLIADHLHYDDPFNADTIETRCSTCSGVKDGARAHPAPQPQPPAS